MDWTDLIQWIPNLITRIAAVLVSVLPSNWLDKRNQDRMIDLEFKQKRHFEAIKLEIVEPMMNLLSDLRQYLGNVIRDPRYSFVFSEPSVPLFKAMKSHFPPIVEEWRLLFEQVETLRLECVSLCEKIIYDVRTRARLNLYDGHGELPVPFFNLEFKWPLYRYIASYPGRTGRLDFTSKPTLTAQYEGVHELVGSWCNSGESKSPVVVTVVIGRLADIESCEKVIGQIDEETHSQVEKLTRRRDELAMQVDNNKILNAEITVQAGS